jgi:predicted transcriptional regulator
MNRGYIKVWRKIEDSGLIGNPDVCQLFLYLLLKATHKARKYSVGKQMIELQPGQFFTGRMELARVLNSTEKKIRNSLLCLEKHEIICTQGANRGTLISIINWDKYQPQEHDEGPTDGQRWASVGPALGQQGATKQEFKHLEQDLESSLRSDSCPEFIPDESGGDLGTEKPPRPPKADTVPNCPFDGIIDLYHEVLPELPRVRVRTQEREKNMRARWRETDTRRRKEKGLGVDLGYIRRLFEYVRECDFLMGRVPARGRDSPWQCDFDWLIKPKNWAKVIEGRYVNKAAA